jgi:hypothetical protein
MLVLFILLLLCNQFLGQRKTSRIVKWLDIPCGFCLRWLSLLFTPSFVTLPLSPRISVDEVLKIAAVFGIEMIIIVDSSLWLSYRHVPYGVECERIDTSPRTVENESGESAR